MKIVIDIPKDIYEDANILIVKDFPVLKNAIINSTPYEERPAVETKELKPLVDKVVEILPELTDAMIKELPKIVNGKIKCSECSYYTNTFSGEWVRKEDVIHSIAKQYSDHNEIVPIWLNMVDLKGGRNEAIN